MQGRGKTTLLSLTVLTACVLTLALPVAAQVTMPSEILHRVEPVSILATVIMRPVLNVSEPAGLVLLGVVLSMSARAARRRPS